MVKGKYSSLFKLLILLPLLTVALTGCKKDEDGDETAREYYYDPRIPFGNINLNTTTVLNVSNLQADTSLLEKIRLTWKIPPIYKTLTHKVFIYKRKDPPAGFNIVCPAPAGNINVICPADEASAAPFYLYQELNAEIFTDQEGVVSVGAHNQERWVDVDADYTYWVFMQINDTEWSSGVKISVHSKAPGTDFELPPPAQFWEKARWSLGFDPLNNNNIQFLQSMNAGEASPGDPRGGISLAFSGNVMYFADTANNRVVIYSRSGMAQEDFCEQFTDEYEKSACLLQFIGAPLTPVNVLGQEDGSGNLPCGGSAENNSAPGGNDDGICELGETCVYNNLLNNECLTAPTRVSVVGNRLFISDSGNNRIVVYNQLPRNGCIQNNGGPTTTPRECTPHWVIGKQGLFDLSDTYTLAGNGKAILKNPTDVVAKESALFIADTGHNRILRIDNYGDRDNFNCTPDTWNTPLCEFDGVLGQEDFFFDRTFEDLVTANPNIILQTGIKDTLHPDYANLLKRYFRKPVRILFTEDEKMLVVANEQLSLPNAIGGRSALHGRILIFDENPIADAFTACNNPAAFDAGECDADGVIGQARFDRLETVTDNAVSAYNQLAHGLYSLDDADLITLPPAEGEDESKQLLMAVSSITNEVYFWYNWPEKGPGTESGSDGFPKDARAVDPMAAPHPATGTLMPDLKSLCAIRISGDTSNIYVTDCGGHRVHEIQAVDYTDL